MDDPFPVPPPPALTAVVAPLASALSLHTLPLHAHELALAAALYAVVQRVVSPAVSRRLFPATYCTLAPRQRLNWDVHVVSLVQSCIVCVLAAMVFWCDRATRANMAWPARVWAYSGAGGLVQAVATGYFLWDLVVSAANVAVFGWGMVGHAVCALFVYALGFVSRCRASERDAELTARRSARLSTTTARRLSCTSCRRLSSTCTGSVTSST